MGQGLKRFLTWTGLVLGALVLVAAGLGLYIYSRIPKPVDTLPPLQAELFKKPDRPAPVDERLVFKDAAELARMIRQRAATSEAIVRAHIAYIKNENYRVNAFVWLREREAIDEARAADAAVARGDTLGVLHGVPVSIKEMYGVKGLPETMNARMFTLIAKEDAPIVAQIRKSGAIVLGTTNVPFALTDFQTSGELYPTGNNPYNVARTPGGSTGGGAAAVAAGFSPLELGSDMGGSVRVPAAFCGLYALKATFGALNVSEGTNPDPSMTFSRMALVSPGFLARTPDDLALMWEAARDTRIDPTFQKPVTWTPASTRALTDYRMAWIDEWPRTGGPIKIGQDVTAAIGTLVSALGREGVNLEKAVPDTFDDLARGFLGSFASMMAEGQPWLMRKLMAWDMSKLDNGSPNFKAFYDGLSDPSDEAWQKLERDRARLVEIWDGFLGQHEFLLSPVVYGPAFEHTTPGARLDGDEGTMPYMDYVAYAYPINELGFPTLSLPLGVNKDGLPIGVQIVGPRFSEAELLRLAKLLESVVPGYVKPKGFPQ